MKHIIHLLLFGVAFAIINLQFTIYPIPVFAQTLTCSPSGGGTGINTAIGCIPVDSAEQFSGFVLKWSIGIGSGIAMLMIFYGAFMVMTSSGDPKRLQAGQELLTATISGLLFIIFSVFLLRIIGVNILGVFK